MYVAIAAFLSALPAFFFAYVALKQRDSDSYEDRLEHEAEGLRVENKELSRKLEDAQEENIRLMRKLLANGSK